MSGCLLVRASAMGSRKTSHHPSYNRSRHFLAHNCNRNSAPVYVLVSTVSCPSLGLLEQRAGHDRVGVRAVRARIVQMQMQTSRQPDHERTAVGPEATYVYVVCHARASSGMSVCLPVRRTAVDGARTC